MKPQIIAILAPAIASALSTIQADQRALIESGVVEGIDQFNDDLRGLGEIKRILNGGVAVATIVTPPTAPAAAKPVKVKRNTRRKRVTASTSAPAATSEGSTKTRKRSSKEANAIGREHRAAPGTYTETGAYTPYIFAALHSMGGQGKFGEVVKKMKALMIEAGVLKPGDDERSSPSARPRFQALPASLRRALVKHGTIQLVADPAGGHFDMLTDSGLEALKTNADVWKMVSKTRRTTKQTPAPAEQVQTPAAQAAE